MQYEAPRVTSLGSVRDLTQQGLNKVGTDADALSTVIPNLQGSIVGT